MPSPDVSPYVDLELLDVDAQALAERAFLDARTKLPEWTPREGNTEVVLIEALALEASESVYATNRLPGKLLEVLLAAGYRIPRDQGSPPAASVTFQLADNAGHTIPAGTTVRLELGGGLDPVDLATDVDLVIPQGATTGTVSASGGIPTLEANGQPAGTTLGVLDAIPYVDSAALATSVTGGREAEDGDSYLERASVRLARLTTTLVRPVEFEAYVAERADVTRILVLDLYNPAEPTAAPGSRPGYVTVAVAGQGGAGLSEPALAAITAELRTRAHAGLVIATVNANVTTVDPTVTVLRLANATDADVEASVRAAVADYLNPDTWAWSGTVRRNELIAVADRAAGVDTVLDVSLPGATDGVLTLPGVAPLARAGIVTVVVQAPA